MAHDYFIVSSDSSNVVRDRVALPLGLVSERHPKMISKVSYGEVDYYGTFTRGEILAFAKDYTERMRDLMEEYPEYTSRYNRPLEYVQGSPNDEFIVSAIYWSSDEY